MTNTQAITVSAPSNVRNIDQSHIGQVVSQMAWLIAAQVGEVTESQVDEDVNPDFMFSEDIDAWEDDMFERAFEQMEENREHQQHLDEVNRRWNER